MTNRLPRCSRGGRLERYCCRVQEITPRIDLTRGAVQRIKRSGQSSERLDLDLAEFDHALVVRHAVGVLDTETVLDSDLSVRELRVLRAVDGLLAVEHNRERRPLRCDIKGVPLAACMRHRVDLGDVDDRSGAIARIGSRIPDIDLVAGLGTNLLSVGAANENAAVGICLDPEL